MLHGAAEGTWRTVCSCHTGLRRSRPNGTHDSQLSPPRCVQPLPQVLMGRGATEKSDVWSFGATQRPAAHARQPAAAWMSACPAWWHERVVALSLSYPTVL